MQINAKLIERNLTVSEYAALRRAVDWSDVDARAAHVGLERSLYSICAELDHKLIGCGRVVGDGGIYLYIQDIIVLPEFQGQGLGRKIMDRVMDFVAQTAGDGAFIGLMAADGVANFYERYGFVQRPKGRPGMFQVWQK